MSQDITYFLMTCAIWSVHLDFMVITRQGHANLVPMTAILALAMDPAFPAIKLRTIVLYRQKP